MIWSAVCVAAATSAYAAKADYELERKLMESGLSAEGIAEFRAKRAAERDRARQEATDERRHRETVDALRSRGGYSSGGSFAQPDNNLAMGMLLGFGVGSLL